MNKISIITVNYNDKIGLKKTIESVVKQTFVDYEFIIIDGGSTDGSREIIEEYADRISYWVSEPDKGIYNAMNKGIQMATGEVIGLINSDDLFCDNFAVEKVMNIFNYDHKLDSVYADLYYVSQTDTNKIVRRWVTGNQKLFKNGWHPAHPTFYIKKGIYDKCGYFNLDFKLAADFEIMLRFLERFQITSYYLAEPIVKMRLGGETNKSLKNIYNQNIECIKAFSLNQISVNKLLYPFCRTIPKLFQFMK